MTNSIEQLKTQLRQLDELARSGALPEEHVQAAKARLERQLVDAIMAGGGVASAPAAPAASMAASLASEPPPQTSKKLIWGMVAFVVAVGAGGYAWLGNPGAWQMGPGAASTTTAGMDAGSSGAPTPAASAPHATDSEQISAMAESLAAKLKTNPKNAEGWAMLARSYAVLGRYDEAITAYKKVIDLRPDDAQIYADYADALAVTQGRKLEGEPARLVAKAMALDPSNFKALSLSGTMAFDKQDFKAAADLWDRALKHPPGDNPEIVRQITSARDDSRQRAGLPPLAAPTAMSAATPGEQPAATNSTAQVSGQVTLSKAAQAKVSPDDTVFIFARPVQGSKMPLAILRKQVKDLPASFTLTDAQAMSPQTALSSVKELVVGARVSKSGQAMPQAGDWQGLSATVKVGAKDIRVEIGEAVR